MAPISCLLFLTVLLPTKNEKCCWKAIGEVDPSTLGKTTSLKKNSCCLLLLLPYQSNARWNSHATYALIRFMLMPAYREQLSKICSFVANEWAAYWFHSQHWVELNNAAKKLQMCLQSYSKALQSMKNFWGIRKPPLDISLSNQSAERAVKVMQSFCLIL